MYKLSELNDKTNVIREYTEGVYTAWDIRDDLQDFQKEGIRFYTVKEYQASINARDMIETAIEYEYDNMYEDWDEKILESITEKDIKKLQDILDNILIGEISYIQDIEIDIFN